MLYELAQRALDVVQLLAYIVIVAGGVGYAVILRERLDLEAELDAQDER